MKSNPKQNWNAQQYDKQSKPQYRFAVNALDHYTFTGNENILDVGCGNGSVSRYMARLPKELQNRFIYCVIQNYLPLVPPNAQGQITYTLPVLTVVAFKPS